MNKKKLLSIAFASVFAFSGVYYYSATTSDKAYSPRVVAEEGIAGYAEYLKSIRANEVTGAVSDADIEAVQAEIKTQRNVQFKADWPLTWEFRGPDNVGGRTRCLVIDKDNPQVLYSGGVSGSVFKSSNGGASWYPLTLGEDNFGVVSMTQNRLGHILYGTGEAGLTSASGGENGTPGFSGMGIFKSTDGETFTSISSTLGFGSVYALQVDPKTDFIYAGSQNGLRVSKDAGETWTLVRGGTCRDIQFNENGIVLASIGNGVWRSTTPDVGASYSNITSIGSSIRSAIGWSESDANYAYVVTVGSEIFDGVTYNGALSGLFRSTDAGVTFTEEVDRISQFFAPFTIIGLQAQGDYDIAIGVHPRDKDRVFIGGIDFSEWSLQDGPKIVGNRFNSPTNPFGIHSDKHLIKFYNPSEEEDPVMYICTDGGISRTTNKTLDRYRDISTNLSTTQFYAVDADVNGRLLGGTQDNNTMLLRGESFPRQIAEDVIGGDGFQTAISKYDGSFMFGESQYGNLRRSVTGGGAFESIWDNRIRASHASASRPTGYFNNALALWENPEVIGALDSLPRTVETDSSINAKLYFAANDGVWVCNNALGKPHDGANPKDLGAVRWFRISNIRSVHYMEPTRDGKSLFVATTGGRLYRIDSLLEASFDTTVLVATNAIASNIVTTQINNNLNLGNRTVTSVAIDRNNPNRVVLTAGNYNNTNFVYVSEDALSASPTWSSVQGNLPRFPVYHAIISADDPNIIVVGTEFGVWATQNGSAATPTWSEVLDGVNPDMPFPKVPVFDLVQVESKSWSGPRIYAATHGMGIWESKSLLASVKKDQKQDQEGAKLKAYPNPANSYINIGTSIKGKYTLTVYDLKGTVLFSENGSNDGELNLNTSEFANGNYFVEVIGQNEKAVSKIIVQH
ncbi:MAG: T9SS type A sorting domain-containing protein [Bacteroidia bacterium]|jgi:hypothetical protein|nr:T9SS type A sorting domain-containing protein [Bacteroidia bacterium]